MRKPPGDAPYQLLLIPSHERERHSLFGLTAQRKGLTALTVDAIETKNATADAARDVASGPEKQSVKSIPIGGRQFWVSEYRKKGPGGKMQNLTYATTINGYVLRFVIVSFDAQLCDDLRRSIESITFFDPANAMEVAGPGSRPFDPPPPSAKYTGISSK